MAQQKVFDRRSQDEAILARDDTVDARVQCPEDAEHTLIVTRSIRDDPIGAMLIAGHITVVQHQAAQHYQRIWAVCESSLRGFDFTREFVDRGYAGDPISDARSRAMAELKRSAVDLGVEGERLVRDVLVDCLSFKKVARRRNLQYENHRKFLGLRFRECLDTLCITFGYATT